MGLLEVLQSFTARDTARDKVTLEVLGKVADMRSASFKEILESIDPQSIYPESDKTKESREHVENAVKTLKQAGLIKERSAPIEDFNSYYVTADGLNAASELRRHPDGLSTARRLSNL
jgi:predicted transcriptional regulator